MGTATVTLVIQVPDRATWDTLKTAIQTFIANHPQITNSNLQYVEVG